MVIRVPDSVVADRYTAGQQGKQDFYRNQMMQRQMLTGIGQDLNAVADYTQDKYLLEQLAAQQPPQVQQPQQDPMEAVAGVFEEIGIDTPEKIEKLANDFSAVVANPSQGVQILTQRANEIESLGGDASDTRMIAQQFQINPQGALQEIRSIAQLAADPKIRAYMARNPARAAQTMGMMGVQNDAALAAQQAAASAKILEAQEKENQEIWKEMRKDLSTSLKTIDADASDLLANYNKVERLAKQAASGNRAAVPQAIVSLVKLQTPNARINEEQIAVAINSPNPVEEVRRLVSGSGTTQELAVSISGMIDPNNPNQISVDDVMDVAGAMVSANAGSIIDTYNQQKDQAVTGGLPANSIKSVFNETRENRLQRLSEIKDKGLSSHIRNLKGEDKQAYDFAVKNPNDPRSAEILRRLGI